MKEIKKLLVENPYQLKELLEHYGFCKISIHQSYLSCARNSVGSPKSIVVRLHNNEHLWVTDYPLNINTDLISYIIQQKNTTFIEVLNTIKMILNIQEYYHCKKHQAFGGFYSNVKLNHKETIQVYPASILSRFKSNGNLRFLRDGISLATQRKFHIGYDITENAITIPIHDPYGQIMGIKARANQDNIEGSKYFYIVPCNMSNTLYGYCQNYDTLTNGEIYIYESEKSVMQCDTMGIHNCVALGSSSLSIKQAKLIAELQPEKIVFLHDEGLPLETVMRNIQTMKGYCNFLNTKIYYWDSSLGIDIPSKASLSDLGKERLLYGLEHELKEVI